MSDDFFEIRERLRKLYVPMHTAGVRVPERAKARGEALGEHGFLTEVGGRVILTAPASTSFTDLPKELASRWQELASGSDHMMWLQGRFVEAEKANRNGAFWSTEDLQFGTMSVNHGPLNWLHQEKTVIGTIADNAVIQPAGAEVAGITDAMPRPFIAAASAVWKWVHPDKVAAIESAFDQSKLFYSMECIGRAIACTTDDTRQGCGKEFDYITAMVSPERTCEHIASRSSARRIVDPSFLGGAVIVPPMQPGWAAANVEIMRQAASLAEQTSASLGDMTASEWEHLMAAVVRFAIS